MDGTCNGLQHFAAMLRDEPGGALVNLTPSEVPQDLYQRVADRVVEILNDRKDDFARTWLGLGVTRKTVKQSVMTLPYGATPSGRRGFIREQVGWKTGVSGKAVSYLEKIFRQAIDDTVKAAPEAMEWLQAVARTMSEQDVPIQWTSPAGLEVMMRELKRTSVEIRWRGKRVRFLQYVEPKLCGPSVIDGKAAVQGIAANFVHSLDAAHLMLTVNATMARGVRSFATVHDSYGTVAADAPILALELRKAFVKMYEDHDPLAELRDRVAADWPELSLPDVPKRGTLDLAAVMKSKYFFA